MGDTPDKVNNKSSSSSGTGHISNPVVIKKYANRRLYNTDSSSYVTLENLCQMVKDGVDFLVYDAKTGEDLTRSVLTQIIVEEESKGQNLLPISFLRQLIAFYGNSMQWVVPTYLERVMETLSDNQEKMQEYFRHSFGGIFPFGSLSDTLGDMSKQNLHMMEKTMRMLNPFGTTQGGTPLSPPVPFPTLATSSSKNDIDDHKTLTALKDQVEILRQQVDILSKKGK
ncbi:MAG: polyhydroxyalkanoate synthesis repressor PhaR [Alphaproteobacteria bacterium]